MSISDYLSKDDITNMYQGMQDCEEYSGYSKMKNKELNIKDYSWEVVDQLYSMKKSNLNKDLIAIQPLLKPQAKDIYYRKKVELVNLVDQ